MLTTLETKPETTEPAIRTLTTEAIQTIVDLTREVPLSQFFFAPIDTPLTEAILQKAFETTGGIILGVYSQNTLIGFSITVPLEYRQGTHPTITYLFMVKEYRGKCFGTNLLEETIEMMRTKQTTQLFASLPSKIRNAVCETLDICCKYRFYTPDEEIFSGSIVKQL